MKAPGKIGRYLLVVLVAVLFLCGLVLLATPKYHGQCPLPQTANKSTFPKILHQVWLQGGELPPEWKSNIVSCTRRYDDYEHRMWSNADIETFISEHYPSLLPVYRSYPYNVQRGDCARYLILLHYGGLYLDTDIDCPSFVVPFAQFLANLTETFPDKQLVAKVGSFRSLATEIIIAKPGSGLLRHLEEHLAEYSTVNYFLNYPTVMFSTGPAFYGNMFSSYACPDQVHLVTHELDRYFNHGCYAHWQSWDGKLINKFHFRWKYYTAGGLAVSLGTFLIYRYIRYKLFSRRVPNKWVIT